MTNTVSCETSQVDFEVNTVGLWNVMGIRDWVGGFAGAGSFFDFVQGLKNLDNYAIRDVAKTDL